jgi:hypothetical protein
MSYAHVAKLRWWRIPSEEKIKAQMTIPASVSVSAIGPELSRRNSPTLRL